MLEIYILVSETHKKLILNYGQLAKTTSSQSLEDAIATQKNSRIIELLTSGTVRTASQDCKTDRNARTARIGRIGRICTLKYSEIPSDLEILQ